MKTALISTTINIPTVFAAYRAIDPDVRFFVAMDKKTPVEAYVFLEALGNVEVLQPTVAKYDCDHLIGHNTDSRRNIALLAALEWGAELLISVDDDMLVTSSKFFAEFECLFEEGFTGLQFGAQNRWLNAGGNIKQRGLPTDVEFDQSVEQAIGVKIGAAQGLILGVPDTDACTAITKRPLVDGFTDDYKQGFVVHPWAHSVYNSQLTAFRRELAPAFAQFYAGQGRNTDLFASLLMRRVMEDRGLYMHFGLPFGYHARKPRPLFNDLKAEMYGLEHIADFAEFLHRAPTQNHSAVEDCRDLMMGWSKDDATTAFFSAWYDDVEKVL